MPRRHLLLSALVLVGLSLVWLATAGRSGDAGAERSPTAVRSLSVERLGKGWTLERTGAEWSLSGEVGGVVPGRAAEELLEAAAALLDSKEELPGAAGDDASLGLLGAPLRVAMLDESGGLRGLVIGDALPVSPGRYARGLAGGTLWVVPSAAVEAVDIDPNALAARP